MRLLLLLLCLQSAAVAAAPRVVTSIAPLQELTAALMEGIAGPDTIIEEKSSAHHFALRPSHMRLLQQADLVIWIDSDFEAGLRRIAETLPRRHARLMLPALGSTARTAISGIARLLLQAARSSKRGWAQSTRRTGRNTGQRKPRWPRCRLA